MLEKNQVAQLLGSTEIFSKLEDKHLAAIANACKVVRFEERARIVTQGEVGQELYIIASGDVSVVQEDQELGIEQPILQLGPKQSFGEASLLAEATRSATVKALTEATCVVLAKRSFDSVLSQIPLVGLEISRYLAKRLHHQCQLTGFRFVSYQDLVFDPELYGTFPEELLRKLKAVPLSLNEGRLTVALTKPNQATTIDALRKAAPGLAIEPVACTSEDYEAFMTRHRPVQAIVRGLPEVDEQTTFRLAAGDIVMDPLSKLLKYAMGQQLNHLIITPGIEGVQVVTPGDSGLKLISQLNSGAEGRSLQEQIQKLFFQSQDKPEVQNTTFFAGEHRCHAQLSQLPTLSGPRFSLRLLEPNSTLPTLSGLLPNEMLRTKIMTQLAKPGQLTLLMGQARSGRSTTAYSLIHHLRQEDPSLNLLTLEERPLADIDNIPQVKVDQDLEMALGASLLHVPDLLLVDEVNLNTLSHIVRASDSGHSTLACMSATNPLQELARYAEQHQVTGSSIEALSLILSQKLLPRLCTACRQEYEPSSAVKTQLTRNHLVGSRPLFFKAEGCKKCRGSGVLGKVPVMEALSVNSMMRELICAGRSQEAIQKSAVSAGLLIPFSASASILLRQGELAPTTALRYFGAGH